MSRQFLPFEMSWYLLIMFFLHLNPLEPHSQRALYLIQPSVLKRHARLWLEQYG